MIYRQSGMIYFALNIPRRRRDILKIIYLAEGEIYKYERNMIYKAPPCIKVRPAGAFIDKCGEAAYLNTSRRLVYHTAFTRYIIFCKSKIYHISVKRIYIIKTRQGTVPCLVLKSPFFSYFFLFSLSPTAPPGWMTANCSFL